MLAYVGHESGESVACLGALLLKDDLGDGFSLHKLIGAIGADGAFTCACLCADLPTNSATSHHTTFLCPTAANNLSLDSIPGSYIQIHGIAASAVCCLPST